MNRFLLTVFFASLAAVSSGQWVDMSPSGYADVDISDVHVKGLKITAVGTRFADFQSHIFTSGDGGSAWNVTKLTPSGRFMKTISFKDADTGYIGGYSSKSIWASTFDGGNTWKWEFQAPYTGLTDIVFVNSRVGFAAGFGTKQFASGGCFVTRDGGRTWNSPNDPLPIDSLPVGQIHFVNEQTGYAVTSEGKKYLLKTNDTASSWSLHYKHSSEIGGVHFWNVTDGVLVDKAGKIFKTSDGGQTWTPKTCPANNGLSSVAFIDNKTGYAVGFYATILKTTDGGETWVKENSPVSGANYVRVRIFNGIAYAVGFNGVIAASAKPTGLNQRNSNSEVKLYPNPAGATLIVEGAAGYDYSVTDIGRRVVLSGTIGKHIDISKLPSGSYILDMTSGIERQQLRFVKE